MKNALFVASALLLAGCVHTPTREQIDLQTRSIEQLQDHYHELVATLHRMEQANQTNSLHVESLKESIDQMQHTIEHHQDNTNSAAAEEPEQSQSEATVETLTIVSNDIMTVGAVEKVTVHGFGLLMNARIDTGATTSSIDAQNIEEFERNGEKWIKFHIADFVDEQGAPLIVETPLIRNVNVRQVNSEQAQKRPVVQLTLQLGARRDLVEFTLTDRSQMLHPVLLGREFLQDIALVDVSQEYIQTQTQQ